MSKGNRRHWSDRIGRRRPIMRRLGALERLGNMVVEGKRFLHFALGDGQYLFYRPSEITAVVRQFEELGLADLLAPPVTEYEEDEVFGIFPKLEWRNADFTTRICDAVGAKAASIEIFEEKRPSTWSCFGEQEAEAWFLANFAWLYPKQNDPNARMDWRLKWAHALGRLMQWRQFWREGHDARSVSRMGSDRGWEKVRAGGKEENKRRAAMRSRWEEWARQRAQTLKSENPRLTRKQLSGLIYAETESRADRANAVGGDCGHDPKKPRRLCFVCTRRKEITIYDKI